MVSFSYSNDIVKIYIGKMENSALIVTEPFKFILIVDNIDKFCFSFIGNAISINFLLRWSFWLWVGWARWPRGLSHGGVDQKAKQFFKLFSLGQEIGSDAS